MAPEGRSRLRGRIVADVPTRGRDWRLFGRVLREVFTSLRYVLVAAVFSTIALTFFVLAQNYDVVRQFVIGGELPLADRLYFLYDLYPLVGPVYSPTNGALLVVVALLIGVTASLLAYQLAELHLVANEGVGGATGVVFGTLGAGCAVCGTALFGGALSIAGVGAGIAFLPYGGLELLALAVLTLVLAAFSLSRSIAADGACPIDLE